MKDPIIFGAGADYGRLASFTPGRVHRTCLGCNGLGYHEGKDKFLEACPHCRGLGWTDLPVPRQRIKYHPPKMSDISGDGERDDARTKAALVAFQEQMAKQSTWRQAVRAALRAADAVGERG